MCNNRQCERTLETNHIEVKRGLLDALVIKRGDKCYQIKRPQ